MRPRTQGSRALLAAATIAACGQPPHGLPAKSAPAARDTSAATTPCSFVDAMPDFFRFWDAAKLLPEDQQVTRFQAEVASRYPDVFNRAVLGYDDGFTVENALRRYLKRHPPADLERVRETSDRIRRMVPGVVGHFRETFPELRCDTPIYLVPSLGAFDGGTRPIGGRNVLLFGVDVITFVHHEPDLSPFITHELFHVFHEQQVGPFPSTGDTVAWNLWMEGLATYVSHALYPDASLAVVLGGADASFPGRAEAALPELVKGVSRALDARDDATYASFFLGQGGTAALPSRGGYYVGYLVAANAAKTYTLPQLARFDRAAARAAEDEALARLARSVRQPAP